MDVSPANNKTRKLHDGNPLFVFQTKNIDEQTNALGHLKTQTNVVIKPSDKGGNTVLLSHPQYQLICYDAKQTVVSSD